MSLFKHKADKKIKVCKKYITSLDGKHQEFVQKFTDHEIEIIPKLREEREALKRELYGSGSGSSLSVEQRMEHQDRIKEINETIRDFKQQKKDYFLNNSKYIFEYFENKQHIHQSSSSSSSASAATEVTTKNQLLFNLFKVKRDVPVNTDYRHQTLVQKYLSNIDESFLDMKSFVRETDICQYCGKGEMTPLDDEGVMICNGCFSSIPFLTENEKPSYKEPPKEVCFYAYKKINHFKEILAQFQGKETTLIAEEVIERIRQQIKKERIGLSDINYYKTKEILKKLGYNKLYEHIAFINNKLGIPPPIFSYELETTLCNLFMEIQMPYAKISPDDRVNFLNYYYVLFKFCELLGETQYLHIIPLLNREKLIEQDDSWKKICVELNWEFIPTV